MATEFGPDTRGGLDTLDSRVALDDRINRPLWCRSLVDARGPTGLRSSRFWPWLPAFVLLLDRCRLG